VVAEVTLVGPTDQIAPKFDQLGAMLLEHVDSRQTRAGGGDGPIGHGMTSRAPAVNQ
jgi:hypothetical protein